jgi:hypothetical protein
MMRTTAGRVDGFSFSIAGDSDSAYCCCECVVLTTQFQSGKNGESHSVINLSSYGGSRLVLSPRQMISLCEMYLAAARGAGARCEAP